MHCSIVYRVYDAKAGHNVLCHALVLVHTLISSNLGHYVAISGFMKIGVWFVLEPKVDHILT
jgi:hypothetical protein